MVKNIQKPLAFIQKKLKKELSNLEHLTKSQLRDFVESMIDRVIVLKNNEPKSSQFF